MTRYIEMACPQCDRGLRVRSEYLGRPIICNHCDHGFEAASSAPGDGDARVDRLAQQIAALEGAVQDAQAERRAVEQVRRDQAETLRDALAECARLQNEAGGLRDRLDRAGQLADDAEVLRGELAAARGELERLRAEIDGMRQCAQASAEAAARELADARAGEDRSSAEARDLQARLDAAEAEVARLRPLAEAQRRLQADRDRVDAERAELSRHLDRAREDLRAARDDLERSAVERQAAQDDLERTLAEQRDGWAAERADVDSLNEWLRCQADTLARELALVVAHRDAAELRTRRLEAELEARAVAEQGLRDQRDRLVDDLERARELAERQTEQNAALREQGRRLDADLERRAQVEEAERLDHERTVDELRRDLDEHRAARLQARAQAEREAQVSREDAEALRAERDAALARSRDLDRRCAQLACRLESIDREPRESNGSSRTELDRLAAALAEANRDRDDAQRLASDLARQAAELQAELDRLDRPDGSSRVGGAVSSELGSPCGGEQFPALLDGNRTSPDELDPGSPRVGEPPPAPRRGARTVSALEPSTAALPLHGEVHWHMEMNRRIAELNRRRRR